MADYEYDVFLSYGRANDWPRLCVTLLPEVQAMVGHHIGPYTSVANGALPS